ncbi:SDR family NAD(P)-dependent oxidoreductase [Kitasatospora sp. NPDC004723]|uniref:SDR family NAD(P)-dependent oxidoreductase n=1 Tax=Kitasatospora sp. NPDC004723 TaxID=3154288 RepID=UPI0033A55B44
MTFRQYKTLRDRLTGTVCLVTGGAQGIGWAVARLLAGHGATVHVCDISRSDIEAARSRASSGSLHFEQVDVTDRHALEAWISAAHSRHGRVDVLVNNAAYSRWVDDADMSDDDIERTMRTSFDAMVHATRAVVPLMLAGAGGQIITMGSLAGSVYVRGPAAAYAAAKAAAEAYSQILRLELAHTSVDVTLVRPGAVAGTNFFRQVSSRRMSRLSDLFPAATPEQVAAGIARSLVRPRPVVNVPAYVPYVAAFHTLAPEKLRRLAELSGESRRDYATARGRRAGRRVGR